MSRVQHYSPNRSLLEIVKDSIKFDWTIEETLKRCNEWQRERMEAEKEVFGTTISRELTASEVRNARIYILEILR